MQLVDLEPDDERLVHDALVVLRELRPHLDAATLAAVAAEGHHQGLRFTAAYAGGRCVGVAAWRIVVNTSATKKLYVDDLVTASGERSRGVGHALLTDLKDRARRQGCRILDLDSGMSRVAAHRFYEREGMRSTALHFTFEVE